MELKALAFPESVLNSCLEKTAGIKCVALNGVQLEAGTVAVVVRDENMLETALGAGTPVIVVIGETDPKGRQVCGKAKEAGIPPECMLYVKNGAVVDERGEKIFSAVSGRGIGIKAIVEAAARAARGDMYPEPVFWKASDDQPVWEKQDEVPNNTAVLDFPDIDLSKQEGRNSCPQKSILAEYLCLAEHVVPVIGAKGGVGASTVSSSLTGVFDGYGDVLHLEAGQSPGGYIYYAGDPEQAAQSNYAYCGSGSQEYGKPGKRKIIFVDVAGDERKLEEAMMQAGCVVVVTDTSIMGMEAVKAWIKKDRPLSILVVNKILYGVGLSPEVYAGELGLKRVVGIAGGSEEEIAISRAQFEHKLPAEVSAEYDAAIGELAAEIREVLGF